LYRNVPTFKNETLDLEHSWDPFYLRIVDYSDHADDLVLTSDVRNRAAESGMVPVYESKLFHSFDPRYAIEHSREEFADAL
jgi:hypothetical protein